MSLKRKVWPLPGGIHPPENKVQSLQTPIEKAPVPKEIILPLGMHIGAPAEAIVSVGDQVKKGQMIARPKGFVSTAIHASSSGTVTAIEPREVIHASGMQAPCIVIETDGKDEWTALTPVADYTRLEKPELLDIINHAGIAGMGGAGFPSRVKLATDKTIEQLIINGTECEPYITADDILMQTHPESIIAGIRILQHLINPAETLIGIEDNKPQAIDALRKATENTDIEVVVFPTKYPSGGEKQLIKILTGKEVSSGGLPADVGVVCQNIGSTYAIHRAVAFGEPLISRITTVTGNAMGTQRNMEVLLGTPVDFILNLNDFHENQAERIIAGGPMMGFTIPSTTVPVVKTTNCLLVPDKKEMPSPPPAQACIRCGMCAEACPVSLLPQQLYWYAQAKDHEGLTKHNLMDCIECGACSYVCPSNIPLVQYYRASKGDIRQTAEDHRKAEYAKGRFEARLARLEKAEAEKEAKRKARQAKAQKPTSTEKAEIEAALARTKKAAPPEPEATTDDPVAAAIARAKNKAGGAEAPAQSPEEKAKADLASLKNRLAKATVKYQAAREANDENLAAFEASVKKLEAKVEDARKALEASTASAAPKDEQVDNNDPVAAAIAKAQASRNAGESVSEEEKLEKDISSLKKRIRSAEAKYQQAQTDNADNVDVFKTSLEKMQAKLKDAENKLAMLKPVTDQMGDKEEKEEVATDDPVQAAILAAQAKREAASSMTEEDKLQKDIDSLEQRIQKTKGKLAEASEDKAEILENSLAKLTQKLAETKNKLAALND